MWFSLAGVIGLGFTLWFNFRALRLAEREAKETKDALTIAETNAKATVDMARQSKEASDADLRAWVTIDVHLTGCHRNADFAFIDVKVALDNIGKTPAPHVGISVKAYVIPSCVINNGDLPELEKWPSQVASLMPGRGVEQGFGVRISKADIEVGVAASRKAGFEPMIVVDSIVYYRTVFDADDAPKRMTSVRHVMFNNIQRGPEFRKERMGWLDSYGPAAVDQVRFSQDKGAPVYMT